MPKVSLYPATNRRRRMLYRARRLAMAKGHCLRPFRLHRDEDWFVARCAFCNASVAVNRDTGDVHGVESSECPKRILKHNQE